MHLKKDGSLTFASSTAASPTPPAAPNTNTFENRLVKNELKYMPYLFLRAAAGRDLSVRDMMFLKNHTKLAIIIKTKNVMIIINNKSRKTIGE